MKKSRYVREMTGWKKHNHNAFLSSSALVNEDWNVNGDWAFAGNVSSTNPISAADPVDADDLVTLGYFETHAGLYQGVLDASAGIPYPAATEGMFWRISVAGVIGTVQVEVGDQVIAIADYAGGMDDTKFMIVQTNTQVTSVTYGQLQSLITNGALEIGRHYLITDYVTAYNIFDGGTNTVIENQVGIVEPLEVVAIGVDALAKEAYSFAYPDDIIYYNAYAKPVDRAAFIMAGDIAFIDGGDVIPNFKGVIEFRHDTKQNVSTWYDFRNIKFRRWAVDAVAHNGGWLYSPKDVAKSGVDGKIYKCVDPTLGADDPSSNAGWILYLDIVADAYVSWTSDKTKFNIGDITTANLVFVPATYQDVYTFGGWYSWVKNVEIGKVDLYYVSSDYSYNSSLNNMVFKTEDNYDTCHDNRFEANGILSTIGDTFYDNVFGVLFNNNILGSSSVVNRVNENFEYNSIVSNFSYNIMGNGFSSNAIGNYFGTNTIGYSFSSNTIGDNFSYNTIGNRFYSNAIGYSFSYNIIGDNSSSNIIKNGFNSNTIGNNSKVSAGINCQGNSIGDYNAQVTLGDTCSGISIGEKNGTITLGATNTNISIGNGNSSIVTGAGCNGVTIHNDNSVVLGINANGVMIGDGNAISGTNNTLVAFRCESRNTLTLADGLLGIQIGNNNAVTLMANCHNLTFLNGCTFTTNTNATALLNTIFESGTSITATDFAAATHIKAAYNKTVFMNATPEAKLSYFDASPALTVVNVNA